jgi:hypothetical protein
VGLFPVILGEQQLVSGVGKGIDSWRPKLAVQTCTSALPKLAGEPVEALEYRLHIAAL